MLGLGGAVSSGSTPESKYSLDFDGANDYVDFNNVLNLSTDFTISMWVKLSSAGEGIANQDLMSKYEDSSNYWYIRTQGDGKFQFQANDGGSSVMGQVYSTALTADVWNHCVVTGDRTNTSGGLKLYVNNSVESGNSSATEINNNGRLYIARKNSDYGISKITDVAIWNAVLDADNIEAIYNSGKPTNLTFDSGDYNQSSALQAYYKMGNGSFDDKANGVIHDQHDPGFGAELVSNGDFSQSLAESDWAAETSSGTAWTISGGKATGTGDGVSKYIQQDVGVVNNKTYKLSYDVVEMSLTNSGSPNVFLLSSASAFGTVQLEYSVGTHVKYVVAKSDGADDNPDLKIAISSNSNGGTISIDNVSLKQVNGFPGLTSNMDVDDFTSDTP